MIDLSDDNAYTFCNIAITWSIKNVIKHVFANKYIKYQLEITNNVMLDNVGIYVIMQLALWWLPKLPRLPVTSLSTELKLTQTFDKLNTKDEPK